MVEIGDEWTEPSAAESESPWSGSGDGELELADESGRTLQDHLAWQLELAHLPPDALAIGRAIVDAINDDGYLTETLEAIAAAVAGDVQTDAAGVGRVLAVVQQFDPAGVGGALGRRVYRAAAGAARSRDAGTCDCPCPCPSPPRAGRRPRTRGYCNASCT